MIVMQRFSSFYRSFLVLIIRTGLLFLAYLEADMILPYEDCTKSIIQSFIKYLLGKRYFCLQKYMFGIKKSAAEKNNCKVYSVQCFFKIQHLEHAAWNERLIKQLHYVRDQYNCIYFKIYLFNQKLFPEHVWKLLYFQSLGY